MAYTFAVSSASQFANVCFPSPLHPLQAGGLGSTGTQRVLDLVPEKIHQRVPLFCGSKSEVEYLESFFK